MKKQRKQKRIPTPMFPVTCSSLCNRDSVWTRVPVRNVKSRFVIVSVGYHV